MATEICVFNTTSRLIDVMAGAGLGPGTPGTPVVLNIDGLVDATLIPLALPADVVNEVHATDGAIALKRGTVFITKGTAAALVLAAPIVGTDDGSVLTVMDTTGKAHTVTTPAGGINGNKATATFGGTVGTKLQLRAYNGVWYGGIDTGIVLS